MQLKVLVPPRTIGDAATPGFEFQINHLKTIRTAAMLSVVTLTAWMAIACTFFNAAPSECVQAAEGAGLSDETIDQLRNPDGLNPVEQAALQRILVQAGIDDICEVGADTASLKEASQDTKRATVDGRNRNQETQEPSGPATNGSDQASHADYAQCLDEVYLRASDDYDSYYWLSAAVWYCQHLEPEPVPTSNPARCSLDQIEVTQTRYPEWEEVLHYWYGLATCNPPPTADATQIGRGSNITPTPYSACLDNAYLAHTDILGNGELTAGVSAWLCRNHMPDPPDTHRQRCDLNEMADTKELYSEWPEELHEWHAIMQCLPDWRPDVQIGSDTYSTCLDDIYWQVADRYDKDTAISAAVWRCRNQMPGPPSIYNPRCEINHLRREEEPELEWPRELYAWNAIVQCYPAYEP